MLEAQTAHTLADSQALQGDVFSGLAFRLAKLAAAVPEPGDGEAALAARLLRGFDGHLRAESAAAALIEVAWVRHLRPMLLETLVPDAATRRLIPPGDASTLLERLETGLDAAVRKRLLTDALSAGWRTCRDAMGADPDSWSWGRLHHALFAHPLSALGVGRCWGEGWDVGPFPVGGAAASVMHAEYRPDTFRVTNGASFRMVVDVGDWDRSVFVNTPGQSGDGAFLEIMTGAAHLGVGFALLRIGLGEQNRQRRGRRLGLGAGALGLRFR